MIIYYIYNIINFVPRPGWAQQGAHFTADLSPSIPVQDLCFKI
jgi:hypothetical protein